MKTLLKKLALAATLATAVSTTFAATEVDASDVQAIRALFLRQALGATTHDMAIIDSILARAAPGQPDPVSFLNRYGQYWGRDAVLAHFRDIFSGTWVFEPDHDAIRIVPLNGDTAQIYAPTRITLGAAGQPPKTATFLINEVAIRTAEGWRISTIVPLATQ